ncbi:3-isopropylmalate dehydratase small subunit (plasmid) [Allorhizobium ampelinum S4]|uniref:3-isopropylmalate dehydratase n=1 Tax=Allorhizobium ampelinum (strain ATCC BAA-846 / DSM 112012 / S4) TaxID=311402 RepID=B9K396_ALLAM|nr:3-isopropylmalate dehydratase small subunit [Allorhizobium ampelinum]ACM39344.1 3-isopropylmalate dehydratase small subunit [Allorhizobium ampelinum S4]
MTSILVVGTAVPIIEDNVDTDQITPGTELMRSADDSYLRWGGALFAERRYNLDGNLNPDFILNQTEWLGATFLLTGKNFGCGSSREWAAKAIRGYGFKAILAESFGEIFIGNCYRHGIAPIVLSPNEIGQLRHVALQHSPITIDLAKQTISTSPEKKFDFKIPEMYRRMLIEGIDEISFVMRFAPSVENFEKTDRLKRPWMHVTRANNGSKCYGSERDCRKHCHECSWMAAS